MFEALRIEKADGVAELILQGPGKGNALGPAFWREMPQAISQLAADEAVRVVVLRGEGRDFTYGLDLVAMFETLGPLVTGDTAALERTRLRALIAQMQGATEGLARLVKPVLAASSGWCIGGGVNLLSACDLRFGDPTSKFSLREVKLAIVPDLGALQRLPRIIGDGPARELAYTGRDFAADEAKSLGFLNAVLPTPEALLAHVRGLARAIAQNPPLVVQGIKQVLEYSAGHSAAEGLEFAALWNAAFLQSRDLAEAFAAFAEKRPPRFEGK